MKNISNSLLWTVIILLVAILTELGIILTFNHGVFTYTLDDAYIHLSLAQNIARGHYGINLQEFSSPSSSIAWPFLLVPFMFFSFGRFAPLLLNIVCAVTTLFVLSKMFSLIFRKAEETTQHRVQFLLLFGFVIGTNMIGLIFSGMEHCLQVLTIVGIVYAVILYIETDNVPWWTIGVLIAAPLVRYESLAVSIPVAVYFFLQGYRKQMTVAMCGVLISLGLFSVFLVHLGLSPLPQSVIVKGGNLSSINPLAHLFLVLRSDRMVLIAATGMAIAFFSMSSKISRKERVFGVVSVAAILLHLFYGQAGWYWRYEIYMWSFGALVLMFLLRENIITAAQQYKRIWTSTFILSLVLLCRPYIEVLVTVPVSANNIYDQQYHMHQFVTQFYKNTVAVNDIGYVSYNNDHYVLDLAGLSSRDAYTANLNSQINDIAWMDSLAKKHDAKIAMIYEAWFPRHPRTWQKIAELRLSREQIIVGGPVVSFFLVDQSIREDIEKELTEFANTLADKENFVIYPLR